jgi:nucleotide-binding universal stress UspA family protein
MVRNPTRILVPTDFSPTADAALTYAKTLAARLGASLHLVHVFADPYGATTYVPEVYAPISPEIRERAWSRHASGCANGSRPKKSSALAAAARWSAG